MNTEPGAHESPSVEHRGAFGPLPSSEHYHGPIWHFTDSNALVSMVENRQLWATAATMLNDPEELVYGAKRIAQWYERFGETLPKDLSLHMQLTQILNDDFVDSILRKPAYVVCASTDYRVLNQWRNYASTSGVAVSLDSHAELIPADPPMMSGFIFLPQWVTIAYQPDEQDHRIHRVLESITSGLIKPALDAPDAATANKLIRGLLAALAASMKDSAYTEEKEVRLIAYLPEEASPSHRGSSRGVVPYMRINHYPNFGWELAGLTGLGDPKAPLPIEEVRVGPPEGESERQRVIGVTSLLRANGSKARVNGSTIRYLPA
ncbi:DUF2971 domain-containing protein [Microbacterium sp. KKR3/1]|uniref:DUF2971 domain-containing protein n=1 Tax=Microbacterium sp. KKR3/1 TaxID=2904241 RepID=UPI001E4EC48B|nr:DUF2971 domain-containing protein [Microbacterium sp. KKR3/1]MCE0508969.1 DUF2971 domain-containing protein [Microbacterium sp. KKR3/1]